MGWFVDWFIEFIHNWWTLWLFLGSFVENIVPPIPSELIMPWWWYLVSVGKISLFGTHISNHILWLIVITLVCAFGSTLWSIPYYIIWKNIHKKYIDNFVQKWWKRFLMSQEDVDGIYEIYQKHGGKLTFFGRFIPVGRGFVWLPAGSTQMSFWKFFGYTLAGSIIWTSILVYIWYYFGDKYVTEWWNVIDIIKYVIIGIVIIVAISFGLNYFAKKYFK